MQLLKLRIAFSYSANLSLLLIENKFIVGHVLVLNKDFCHLSDLDFQPIVKCLLESGLQLELSSNSQED